MRAILTVVVGYTNGRGDIKSSAFTVEFGLNERVCVGDQIREKIEAIRKSWPKEYPGLQNVLSVSHSIIP